VIKIGEEEWSARTEELLPLFMAEHHELSDREHIAKLPLDIDWDFYAAVERNGGLLLIVARSDGRAVGHSVSFVHPHPHYRTKLFCQVDTYFLLPEFRMPDADSLETLASPGAELLIETEEAAVRRGAVKIVNHTRMWKDNQRLFDMLGYREVERLSTKWIGG
jgi:hypothetical protein